MKVILINGFRDNHMKQSFIKELTDSIDEIYNNECVMNISTPLDEESEKEAISLLKDSYKDDDYDVYVYSSNHKLPNEDLISRIETLCNIDMCELLCINEESMFVDMENVISVINSHVNTKG